MPTDIPCCPVLKAPYEANGPNMPRSLPCGHSISHAALTQVLKQRADGRQCPIDRNLLREASSAAYSYPPNYALIEVITAGTLIAQQAPAGECDEMGDEELAVEAVALSRQEVEARVQEEIIRQMAAEKVQYERRQEEKKKQIELAWEVLRKSEIQAFLTTIGDDLVEKARAVLASALEL